MFTKDAITEIQQAEATARVYDALANAMGSLHATVFAPSDFTRHDLEKLQPNRRRARGKLSTSDIGAFRDYTLAHKETGATVFLDADAMSACAVLNLGDSAFPGHADNTSTLKLKATAAYTALLQTANGRQISQQTAAEFLEDWAAEVQCFGESGGQLQHGAAVAALRKLTIDTARKVESAEGQLSASLSVMEQVKASSETPVPTTIYFACTPYHGLQTRSFVLRLAVHTTGDKPTLSLRVKNLEGAQEEMAQEFANKVREAIDNKVRGAIDNAIPVVIGTYETKD
jgi:uncharacterized protein YfdQ (DUF2303 family)